jgi:hypothetical protein
MESLQVVSLAALDPTSALLQLAVVENAPSFGCVSRLLRGDDPRF